GKALDAHSHRSLPGRRRRGPGRGCGLWLGSALGGPDRAHVPNGGGHLVGPRGHRGSRVDRRPPAGRPDGGVVGGATGPRTAAVTPWYAAPVRMRGSRRRGTPRLYRCVVVTLPPISVLSSRGGGGGQVVPEHRGNRIRSFEMRGVACAGDHRHRRIPDHGAEPV